MNKKSLNILDFLFLAFIVAGVIISVVNFFNFRSLWLDEAMLSLNIVDRSFSELCKPMDMIQIAPIGFLMIEKSFVKIFGDYDWALRIFPFFSYILSIPLFFVLSNMITNDKRFALFATASLGLSRYFIRYSSEVKQYSMDVLIVIILVLSTLAYLDSKRGYKHTLILGFAGAISIWFSNISVILLFSLGLYYLFIEFFVNNRKDFVRVLFPVFLWIMSFVVYYFLFVYKHPSWARQLYNWEKLGAFFPKDILEKAFVLSVFSKAKMWLSLLNYGRFLLIPSIVTIIGGFLLFNKSKSLLFVFIFPVLIHFGLSYFRLYPFHLRLILYQTPLIVFIFSFGLYRMFKYMDVKYGRVSMLIIILPLFAYFLTSCRTFPFEKEEIKKSLEYINNNINPSDNIYVFFSAKPAFLFYEDQFPKILSNKNIKIGSVLAKDWNGYNEKLSKNPQEEICNLKGTTWMIFSHKVRQDNMKATSLEAEVLNRLKIGGVSIISEKHFIGSSVFKVR